MIDVAEVYAGLGQHVGKRVLRELGVMLAPGEPLFLGCRDNAAILDQCGGAVVVKCRNPTNIHAASVRTRCR